MQATMTYTLTDDILLSVHSGKCATVSECVEDISPALEEIKKLRQPSPRGYIAYLIETGKDIARVK